jgi:hypothetical protein
LNFVTSLRGFSFLKEHVRKGLRIDDGYCQDDEVCGYCGNYMFGITNMRMSKEEERKEA